MLGRRIHPAAAAGLVLGSIATGLMVAIYGLAPICAAPGAAYALGWVLGDRCRAAATRRQLERDRNAVQ